MGIFLYNPIEFFFFFFELMNRLLGLISYGPVEGAFLISTASVKNNS